MCLEKCSEEDRVPNCGFDLDEHHPSFYDDEHESRPIDSNDREYNPWAGSQTPTEGRCNALLRNYDERYGEKRYCMGFPDTHFTDDPEAVPFCKHHRGQAQLMKNARDVFKHGLFSQSVMHVYDKLPPLKKLVALGTYDSLVQESAFDFDTDRQEHYIDFTDIEPVPLELETELDEDGYLGVEIPVPTSKVHRCLALYHASIDEVKKINVNETLLEDGIDHESTVGYTEDGREITALEEHPLNLPYSRLVKDHKEHLEYGGIQIGTDDSGIEMNNVEMSELIVDVDPDPEAISNEGTTDNPMHQISSDDIEVDN